MRFSLRNALMIAAGLSLAAVAGAQTPITDFPVDSTCSTAIDPVAAGGELYAVKIVTSMGGGRDLTDWLCDVRTKAGGQNIGGADETGGVLVPSNWSVQEAPAHDVHIFVTFPNGMLTVDSGNLSTTAGAFNYIRQQHVGDWLANGTTGMNGRGVTLPAGGGTYSLTFGAGAKNFPFGAKKAVEVAFAKLIDVNNTDVSATGIGCTLGGEVDEEPGTTNQHGLVIGYNVYRVAGTAGAPPAAMTAAQWIGAWSYFARTDGFAVNVADTAGTGMANPAPPPAQIGNGSNAPNDSAADTDIVGFDNTDGVADNGDEIVLFADQATNPDGSARMGGQPGPTAGQGYWYAFQPVVDGDVTTGATKVMDTAVLAGLPAPAGGRGLDLDGNGTKESVDIDGVPASPEFISPQAQNGAQPGLGLTNGGLPLVSNWVFGQIDPAPATGDVVLTGQITGANVALTLTSAIEAGNVLGFNVYRLDAGNARAKVNDQIIAARGGEGSVYSLVDKAEATSQRVRRSASLQYEVDVVYNDGTATRTVGPFAVNVTRGETSRRTR